MTTWAALLAILGALGYVLGLRRKAARAAAERDQQQARAERAEADGAVQAEVRADQQAARRDEAAVEVAAERAAERGEAHPERAAARERAARQAEAAAKVRRLGKAGRK